MKIRTVIGLTGATAASLVGAAGLAASPAGADAAQTMPAADLSSTLGLPAIPVFASPFTYPGEPAPAFVAPNTKVSGNCLTAASWLFTDFVGLNFVTGNAVVYQLNSNPTIPNFPPGLPGGLNAEGTAQLFDFNTGQTTTFVGPAHLWMGQNSNANGQYRVAQTVSFTGTDLAGSTISFSVNPGETHSASGHNSGWGQQNLNCNIMPGDGG